MSDVALSIYFAIAAVVCIATWIDNSRVHYVFGNPPSGILAGFLWPLGAAVLIVAVIVRACSKDPR